MAIVKRHCVVRLYLAQEAIVKRQALPVRAYVITMPLDLTRYPDNWTELALSIKEAAGWRCQCCQRRCYRPGERPQGLTRSEWTVNTLQVHHRNHKPEDNRRENLLAVCSVCHLAMHVRGNGNVSPGQLSLF